MNYINRKVKVLLAGVCISLFASMAQAVPQEWVTEEVLKQLADIKKELIEVQKELKTLQGEVKKNVAAKPYRKPKLAANAELAIGDAPTIGDEKAQVAIIEFSDYQCPYCRRHFKQTLPALKENYVDTGKIKYVMKQYPLSFHTKAKGASIAALCSEKQKEGSYWDVHHKIFSGDVRLSEEGYIEMADKLGLKAAEYADCLVAPEMASIVDQDIADGTSVGVSGTPAFLVGKIVDGKVVNAQLISGARPYAAFTTIVDGLLK